MTLTQKVLAELPPRYSAFDYYLVIIEKITRNSTSNPDIAIESCKSLIEGLSKSILTHTRSSYREKGKKTDDVYDLFKKAIAALADAGAEIEEDFTRSAGNMVIRLGAIRNERGDISHGKSAPKLTSSKPHFSNLILQVTDGLAAFMLEELFALDLTKLDPISYYDHESFNRYLDELVPMEGKLSYSMALFDQDVVAYEEQLKEFQTELEERREVEMRESSHMDWLTDMKPEPSPDSTL